MEKFLFLIRENLNQLQKWTEEERYNGVTQMKAWVKTLAQKGNYLSGEALLIRGGYVSKDHVLSDGPFIEAKEGVSGIIFMEANDLQDAIAIAQTCPKVRRGEMVIEVRPIMNI